MNDDIDIEDIKIEEDPNRPGRYTITMPDPTPTPEEMEKLRAIARRVVREEFAKMRGQK